MWRRQKTGVIFLLGVLGVITVAKSDEKAKESRGIISIIEFIEVSKGDLKEHFSGNSLTSDAAEFRKAVQLRVKSGKAKIRETFILNTRSGRRGKSEAVREIFSAASDSLPESKEIDPKNDVEVKGADAIQFQTRQFGGVLEIQPTIQDDGSIIVSVDSEITAQVETARADGDSDDKAPAFSGTNVTPEVTLKNGGYAFLGASQLANEQRTKGFDDSILLIFLRVDSF